MWASGSLAKGADKKEQGQEREIIEGETTTPRRTRGASWGGSLARPSVQMKIVILNIFTCLFIPYIDHLNYVRSMFIRCIDTAA